jgi:hypothetical protein
MFDSRLNIRFFQITTIFRRRCKAVGPGYYLVGMRKIFETSIMSSIDTSNLKHRCAKYIDQKISIFLNIDISKKKE